ncbi:MAG TPA: serine/threonine-protein kinase [Pirellulales bacterium]|nr:serine/threonine-protein kinase [Pirellulales bacterium]
MSVATSHTAASITRHRARRPPPPQLDRWELAELVAETPWARVYRARPTGSGASAPGRYAIKVVRDEIDPSAACALIEREWRIGRMVRHRSLVPVLDAQSERPPYWIAMPWLDGRTLAERLQRGRLSEGIALWYARQVAEALAALDAAGWMHGDVKPTNVMVSTSGHVTLIDTAFARRRGEARWTMDAEAIGTPQYMAPEMVVSALRPDIRSDIYSLGIVLYEMLSGDRPFGAWDVGELLRQHRDQRPRPLHEIVPRLSRGTSDLVGQMLAKEPLRRPQTPAELSERLARLEIERFTERIAV